MLIIDVRIIEDMIRTQTRVGLNPSTKVRVSCIRDKLFVEIVKNRGILRRIAKIQRRKGTILLSRPNPEVDT